MNDVRLVATNPEDNTLVPVASNSSGQLAVQSPKIEKVPNDLDVEGNLTVSGTGNFAGHVQLPGGGGATKALQKQEIERLISAIPTPDLTPYVKKAGDNMTGTLTIGDDKIKFAANTGDADFPTVINIGGPADGGNAKGCFLSQNGRVAVSGAESNKHIWAGYKVGWTGATSVIRADGKVFFTNDVIVGSRNKQWMLVEQGGLCHMVEQTQARTADLLDPDLLDPDLLDPDLLDPGSASEYPRLRDVFAELNVVEKALEEVMEKLRMTAPDGWPVWDGSDNS